MNIEKLSGCELEALLKQIGAKNISMFLPSVLSEFSDESLLDEIVNNRDCDIGKFIMQLFAALTPLNDEGDALLRDVKALVGRATAMEPN